MADAFAVARLEDIPAVPENEPTGAEWRPVRHHFDIQSFGVNAFVQRPGEPRMISEHDEAAGREWLRTEGGHEELYFVVAGQARFTIDGESVDAPAGTFVFVHPNAKRAATAETAGTTILAVGGAPGEAFKVSKWEEDELGGVEG